MKAIFTTFRGATNTQGSRITASDEDGNRASIPYLHDLDSDAAHDAAVVALCKRMGWGGKLARGGMKTGYVYVWIEERGCPPPLNVPGEPPPVCGEKVTAPDDLIAPCVLRRGHLGFHDTGR